MSSRRPNRLLKEKSPYLQQHAYNPVDWHPWGGEAFQKAKAEGKLVFLSIGYSTCHWCHVMEKESFEDEEVAEILNRHFVSIKVDREERPDIDQVYMSFCQALTGSGGWPLSLFLTPEEKPFFAGTYFPKESRLGQMGFKVLLQRVHQLWEEKPEEVVSTASKITQQMRALSSQQEALSEEVLAKGLRELTLRFDATHGGFGTAPKFPIPHQLDFLLTAASLRLGESPREKRLDPLSMATETLQKMRSGGVFDQVGFGFHRYSTDAEWHLPHFEKMLYDQALLAATYLDAYALTQSPFYAQTAQEILTYVLRDLRAEEGGFYSAEDADSEGEEGKFYLWGEEELREVLNEEEFKWFSSAFGVSPEGNFLNEAGGKSERRNVLHYREASPLPPHWERLRSRLFLAREKRVRPLKDTKILTDWNGLTIRALSKAARLLDKSYLEEAERTASFLLEPLERKERLFHRYRDGEWGIEAKLDDVAFLLWGCLELYAVSLKVEHLLACRQLASLLERFWDREGGFFMTQEGDEELIVRPKEFYDGALPSGNGVAAEVLLTLSSLTGEVRYRELAEKTLLSCPTLARAPSAHTQLLKAYLLGQAPRCEVVVVGERGEKETEAMLSLLQNAFRPWCTVLFKGEGDGLERAAPFTQPMARKKGSATAYLCRNFQCEEPLVSAGELAEALAEE